MLWVLVKELILNELMVLIKNMSLYMIIMIIGLRRCLVVYVLYDFVVGIFIVGMRYGWRDVIFW